jgi:hypothetical protein
MRLLSLFVGAAFLVVPSLAPAQERPDLPTDTELRAAYCLGHLFQLFTNYGIGYGIPEVDAARRGDIVTRENRFASYLHAHGYPADRSTTAKKGVSVAIDQGEQDEKGCLSKTIVCTKTCDRVNVVACIHECQTGEHSCRSTMACDQDNALPF